MTHQIVSHEEWLTARKAFLEKDEGFYQSSRRSRARTA